MSRAWYSVVQYRPRLDRAEGANVGVLLFAPDKGFLDLRMSSSADRVRKMFGRDAVDSARFALAVRGLARRVKDQAAGAKSLVELRRVLRREGNQLQFGSLLEISAENPRATLNELFAELVTVETEPERRPRRIPEFDAFVEHISMLAPVQRDVEIDVPLTEKPLRADFVYLNGKRNIVKGQWFHKRSREKARELGSDGVLIAKEGGGGDALIIVSKFDDPTQEDAVRRILRAHGVRTVSAASELDAFRDEILRDAHD